MTFRTSMILLVLALALGLAGVDPARAADSWPITAAAVLPGGEPANSHIRDLVERLASEEGPGEPVTLAEFRAHCERSDPAADHRDLMRYAAPGSVKRQDMDHNAYARTLMREPRIEAGARFLSEHGPLLRAAQNRFGVARQDIVAILMWESGLGKWTGKSRVFNLLLAQMLYLEEAHRSAIDDLRSTQSYDPDQDASPAEWEKRSAKLKRRAVSNLTALLRITKAKGQDPTALRGSWAGAIGYPQFMPASFALATDGDGDGVIDLNHWPDAIFSVASYLEAHGYNTSYAGRKRGLHAYNPIDSYVHGVIRYADAIIRY
jgi:membrane-bound lytic murein transglycosylase B